MDIVVHFMSTDGQALQVELASFIKLEEGQEAVTLFNALAMVTDQLGVRQKLRAVTADNASTGVLAFVVYQSDLV